MNLINNY